MVDDLSNWRKSPQCMSCRAGNAAEVAAKGQGALVLLKNRSCAVVMVDFTLENPRPCICEGARLLKDIEAIRRRVGEQMILNIGFLLAEDV